jgi:hypothetical protein
MPQSCSSDAPSLHQLTTAATIAPSQEPGLQALAHGFTGSRPSHGGQTDKDGKQQQPDSRLVHSRCGLLSRCS